jgi:hypothetical protein
VTEEDARAALLDFRHAYSGRVLPDIQAGQFLRLFRGYQPETVGAVIDDLVRLGLTRPAPAEMGELLRTKGGRGPAGGRARRYGPTQADDGWEAGMVPANEAGWLEAATEAKRALRGARA